MTILKLKPQTTQSLPSSLDRTVDQLFNNLNEEQKEIVDFIPNVNILENKAGYTIQLALPGYNKKHIEISLEKDILKIHGNKEEHVKTVYHVEQLPSGRFVKSFQLPEEINKDKIVAKFEQGILNLRLAKHQDADRRKSIAIN